jgi:hypothetical protein
MTNDNIFETITTKLPISFSYITVDKRDKGNALRAAEFPVYGSRLSVCTGMPKPISKLLLAQNNDQI